jgi:hypothetical protein
MRPAYFEACKLTRNPFRCGIEKTRGCPTALAAWPPGTIWDDLAVQFGLYVRFQFDFVDMLPKIFKSPAGPQ